MISYIVIGKNEGWKLSKCIQSIIDTTKYNQIEKYEIIYVDSNSTDESIKRALEFNKVRIFKLTGDTNPAIGRNIGAKESEGDILFFLDGDMEINKKVFLDLFNRQMSLKYDFISGDFENFYYKNIDSKKVISKEMYHKNKKISKNFTTGGLFAINRDKWFEIDGMREIFNKGEDLDLGLRLSKKRIYMFRLPINLVKHHTVSYSSKSRIWSNLWDTTHLYGRSLLYRKNLSNFNTLKLIAKQDYSLLLLVVLIIVSLSINKLVLLLLYLFVLFFRSVAKKNVKYIYYFLLRDFKVLLGFLLFYPKKNNVSYISIQ